ncbi:DUF305 domain-containing protein [Propionivibrio soli]|uniref:DUF305 domain-containing protein n=1 Tax=Propionivibrio soli TaxID=2976531 RepID=UPI0021E8F530|nr:DUF305 domain-containing protein [Propionivibrio soli]
MTHDYATVKSTRQWATVCLMALAINPVFAQEAVGSKETDELSHSMMKGMEQMQQMKSTGDVDKDFATMMKMHHQQAVDMARVEVEHGKSAQLKRMAKKIIEDQKKEIEAFDKWLKNAP